MDIPLEKEAAQPAPRRRKRRIWLAVLPAFLLTMASSLLTILNLAGLTPAWADPLRLLSRSNHCAVVYGVNLFNSEYYVRESSPGSEEGAENPPRELSTVVGGMLENKCPEPIESVTIHFIVRDDAGKRWSGEATVNDVPPWQAKPFERAWLGQIVSYEITSVR
jgi:hypothetical protein